MGIVSVRVRKQVFRKCNGNCAYCGNQIEFKAMQVDHLVPTYWNWDDEKCKANNVIRGTDEIENLMPACRLCNRWKGEYSLDLFRDLLSQHIDLLVRNVPGAKVASHFDLLRFNTGVDSKPVIVFYFEKIAFKNSHVRVTGAKS